MFILFFLSKNQIIVLDFMYDTLMDLVYIHIFEMVIYLKARFENDYHF